MNRRRFLIGLGKAVPVAALGVFLLSEKSNLTRGDLEDNGMPAGLLEPDELGILRLASLAPSGHNSQPWAVRRVEPFRWIVENEPSRWLPAVDPDQRETILSIGAFAGSVELAAGIFGYDCSLKTLANTNRDREIAEVRLTRSASGRRGEPDRLISRRTLRGLFSNERLRPEDVAFITESDSESFRYLPAGSREARIVSEETVAANRIQIGREEAQKELSEWVRFSNREAEKFRDGLTTASMEIDGLSGWMVRNLYVHENVLSPDFRERSLARVAEQSAANGGWIVVRSKGTDPDSLLTAGARMQRLFVRVRERGIAIHPMTQILEETATRTSFESEIGEFGAQFVLRTGYVDAYPEPVSMRRPPAWFVKAA